MATVSSTWTCGAVIGTISAAFGTLRGPASLSAMGGGMQCREGIQRSGGVWRGMLSLQGPSILLIDLDSSPNLFLSGSCSQKSPGQVGAYRGMKVMK